MLEAQDAVAGPDRVRRRHPLQGERQGLDDKIVDRKLVRILWRAGIGLLADLEERVHRDVGDQIKMRDGLLRLDQTARDGGAHAVERHLLELDALVERLDLRGRRAGWLSPRAGPTLGDGGFD